MSTVTKIILRGVLVQMQSLHDQIQFHSYLISQTFIGTSEQYTEPTAWCVCVCVCVIQNTDMLWFMTL
jgi:hypothetical protein